MIRSFMLLPAIVCPLLGCTLQRSDHYTAVFVDLPPDMQAEAIAALDDWSGKSGGAFSYDLASTCDRHCMFFFADTAAHITSRCQQGYDWGCNEYYQLDDRNYILVASDAGHRDIVFRHEIGHALGLVHTWSCNSVMHPGTHCAPHKVTCVDVETFASVHRVVADCVE